MFRRLLDNEARDLLRAAMSPTDSTAQGMRVDIYRQGAPQLRGRVERVPVRLWGKGGGSARGNDYLDGNYAPVRREHTVTELAVTGAIPQHLDGRYLRHSPHPVAEIDPQTYQWFMGDGMVHGVRLRDWAAAAAATSSARQVLRARPWRRSASTIAATGSPLHRDHLSPP